MNLNKLTEIAFALYDPNHSIRSFHVSFLLRRNKILSIGVNKNSTHPTNLKNRKFNRDGRDISSEKLCCSEFICLKKSKSQNINYHKCRMVNIRITRENKLGMSAPCESCLSLIRHFQIPLQNIYFTDDSGGFTKY